MWFIPTRRAISKPWYCSHKHSMEDKWYRATGDGGGKGKKPRGLRGLRDLR